MKKTTPGDEPGRGVHRAPQVARVVQDPPRVDDVEGAKPLDERPVENGPLLDGPVAVRSPPPAQLDRGRHRIRIGVERVDPGPEAVGGQGEEPAAATDVEERAP